ncbi:MAG: VOC family protein [Pseudomonadota bacterium]
MQKRTDNAEVFPLLWTDDVGALADWAVATLGLTESWRAASDDGVVEHAELLWQDGAGRISINIRSDGGRDGGPSGISLRVDDRAIVDALHARAEGSGARLSQPLAETVVAYSFTVLDADGNQWWVNAETGMLDGLRAGG